MVTHAPNTDEQVAAPRTRSRIRPHQVVIGIGIAFAVFTALSGLVPQLTKWHEEEGSVGREVFGGIPDALKLVFYTITPVLLIAGALLFAQRVKNWERGGPDNRPLNPKTFKKRLESFRAATTMKTLLRDPAAGVMHSMIYFGFLVLLGVTTVLEINHQLPEDAKFLTGTVYQGYIFIGDLAGLVFLGGILLGVPPPVHPAALPHPHQDQARALGDPRRVRADRRHRVHHRDVPDRERGHARRSRSGPSSGTRSPSCSTGCRSAPWRTGTGPCGSCTWRRSSPSSSSCRSPCCATCSRRR